MTREEKEQLIELLEDYMWEHNDAELTMECVSLQEQIREEL